MVRPNRHSRSCDGLLSVVIPSEVEGQRCGDKVAAISVRHVERSETQLSLDKLGMTWVLRRRCCLADGGAAAVADGEHCDCGDQAEYC